MHQVVLAASIISKSGKGMGWMALVKLRFLALALS
jgi:hypothetical protein